jgi:DNA-binding transcriptional MerR regulator
MSICRDYLLSMPDGLTLAELAHASGLQPRTIRSWVAQGLLPGPLSRGPAARYPADQLERILAIRTMKELHGMALADIRQELLVASAERVAALAQRAATIAPEPAANPAPEPGAQPVANEGAALDFFRALRGVQMPNLLREIHAAPSFSLRSPDLQADTPTVERPTDPTPRPVTGFEALEQRLTPATPRAPKERRTRAVEQLTIEITPDIELSVRGKLDADQRARLERCAELMRDILTGRE